MTVQDILSGNFKPEANGRITAVSPLLVKELTDYITNIEMTIEECKNLVNFLDLISPDFIIRIIHKNNNKMLRENLVNFAKMNVFQKFINRVSSKAAMGL